MAGVTFVASVIKVGLRLRQEESKESHQELEGCLHTIQAVMTGGLAAEEQNPRLRVTVHLVLEDGQQIVQLLEYVGDTRKRNTAHRHFNARSGVTGKCLQIKKPVLAERQNDNHELFVQEMMSEFSYSEEDARSLDPSSVAWLAIPIGDTDEQGNISVVNAVLYMDVVTRGFFTETRYTQAISGARGIARFIKERYN